MNENSYYYIEPEVAGTWGNKTVVDVSVHPPVVHRLHHEFQGWLGDDLIESFPCFLTTDRLKTIVLQNNFSGVVFKDAQISFSSLFHELYPNKKMPLFFWMQITGKAATDDFGLGKGFRLVISNKVLLVLNQLSLNNAEINIFA